MVVPPPTSTPPPHQKKKEQALQSLKDFHSRTIGMTDRHPIRPFYLVSMRENLPQLSGEPILDDLVCVAYININTGKDDVAVNIFNLIMQYRTDLPSVCIGLGSIYAMQRKFDDAILQFSNAVDLNPDLGEAYKRRGQTRAAKGQTVTALKDLSKAVSLCSSDSGDSHFQRGLLYHQTKNYSKGLNDFREALRRGMVVCAAIAVGIGIDWLWTIMYVSPCIYVTSSSYHIFNSIPIPSPHL